MPISVRCSNPACGQILPCPDDLAGQQVRCPKCRQVSVVPAPQLGGAEPQSAASAGGTQPTPAPTAGASPARGKTTTDSFALSQAATESSRRLGRYAITRKIGQGGMGTVFEAVQDEINRRVALKVLSKRLMKNEAYLERFRREARSAGALNHPNIVTVFEFGEDKGHLFFSMEFVEGETLQQRLKREGRVPVPDALAIVTDLARALDYGWKHGQIIHRDIKPENIMITPEGYVKLADLGLAKAIGTGTTVTQEGAGMGTPAYMAPEQGRGARDVDCRADIYSLGITLFHTVTGELPFDGETPLAVMLAHTEQALPDPQAINPEIPSNVCQLIERMCAKSAEDRYPTPGDLLTDLEAVRAGEALAFAPGARDSEAELRTIASISSGRARSRAGRTRRPRDRRVPRKRNTAASFFITFAVTLLIVIGIGGYVYRDVLLERWQEVSGDGSSSNTPTTTPPEVVDRPHEDRPSTFETRPKASDPVRQAESRVEKLLQEGAYGEAMALLNTVAGQVNSLPQREAINPLKERVAQEALKRFKKDRTDATVLCGEDRFDEALSLMKNALGFGLDAITEEATDEVSRILVLKARKQQGDVEAKEEEPEAEPPAPDPGEEFRNKIRAFAGLRSKIDSELKGLNYSRLPGLLDAQAALPANADFKDDLAGIKQDIEAVQGLWGEFLKLMEESKGRQTTFGVKTGKISQVKDGLVVLEGPTKRHVIALDDMQPSWLEAELGLSVEAPPQRWYALAVFYAHKGREKEARDIFDKLGKDHPGVGRHRRWLEWGREAEALEALVEIQEAVEAESPVKTIAMISDFREKYRGTQLASNEEQSLKRLRLGKTAAAEEMRDEAQNSVEAAEALVERAEEALRDWYEGMKEEVQNKHKSDLEDHLRYTQSSFTGYEYYSYSSRGGSNKKANLEVINRCLAAFPRVSSSYYSDPSYMSSKKKRLMEEKKRLEKEIAQAGRTAKSNAAKLMNLYEDRKRELHNRSLRLLRKLKSGDELNRAEAEKELLFWQ